MLAKGAETDGKLYSVGRDETGAWSRLRLAH